MVAGAAGDEDRTRRAQRDQHVRVDRHVVPVPRVFLKVAREPVGKILRHVVDSLAKIAAGERRPHLTRTARVDGGDALIQRRRPQRGLPQPGMPEEGDVLRCRRLVGHEVIDDAADAPRPGADRSPFLRARAAPRSERLADHTLIERIQPSGWMSRYPTIA